MRLLVSIWLSALSRAFLVFGHQLTQRLLWLPLCYSGHTYILDNAVRVQAFASGHLVAHPRVMLCCICMSWQVHVMHLDSSTRRIAVGQEVRSLNTCHPCIKSNHWLAVSLLQDCSTWQSSG